MTGIVADLQNLLQGQNGILFWIALAAITCGFSFLLTGVYLHLRRLWSLRRFRGIDLEASRATHAPAETVAVEAPVPEFTPQQRDLEGHLPPTSRDRDNFPPVVADLDAGSLPTILQRLRQAADSLENIADELVRPGNPAAESPLKHLAGDVEYVFRASRH